MGKQLRFVITEKKQAVLIEEIKRISKENSFFIYNIKDRKIISDYKINDSIYLFEKVNLKYIHNHMNNGVIDGLYENGLEVDLSLSTNTQIYEHNRVWIDESQYREEKTTLYRTFEEIIKFIKKNALGYNKDATEWMFFEQDYMQIYKELRKKIYDEAVKKSKLSDVDFKIIIEKE